MILSTEKYACVRVCYCKWYVPWSKSVCVCERKRGRTPTGHTHFIISHTLTPAAEVRGVMVQIWLLQMEPLTPNSLNLTERETSHSSHLTQRAPQELKETHMGGRGSLHLPFLVFLILSITETVFTREKRTAALGPRDSSCNITRLIIFFSCTHTVGSKTWQHTYALSLGNNIQLCISWIIILYQNISAY